MPQADALAFYARVFDTVEVNATFHAVPRLSTVRGWLARTPPHFRLALKTPRAITHDARLDLAVCEPTLAAFLEAADLVGERLAALLVQLPPSFDRSAANRLALAGFLDRLPTHRLRVVAELRHPSWAVAEVERALADRGVAWCLAEGIANTTAALFPADFTYVRWNRSGRDFPDFAEIRYDRSEALDWWADLLQGAPARVATVYGYMSDEFAGHAPASLRMLQARLGLPVVEPRSVWPQPRLL